MQIMTYFSIALLMNSWIIGVLGYGAGGIIHILLVIAFFVIAFKIYQDYKLFKSAKMPHHF